MKAALPATAHTQTDYALYECIRRATLRVSASVQSQKTATLEAGDRLAVLEVRSIDGQLRVRGVQGWASLIKKSTGEELFRGVAEGDLDKVQAIQVESGHNMSQVQQDIAHDSGSESDTSHILQSGKEGGDPAFAVNRGDDDRSSDAGSTPPVTPRAADPQGSAGKGVLAAGRCACRQATRRIYGETEPRQLLLAGSSATSF